MSRKQHERQMERARAKRQATRQERRAARNRVVVLVMAVLLAFSLVGGAAAGLLGGRTDDPEPPVAPELPEADDPALAVGPCGPTPDDVPPVTSRVYDAPFELTIDRDATYLATIATTCGDIVVELDAAAAPLATNNLVNLARDGYFDGVLFHRVIPGFVAQVGDPAGTGCGQEDCTQEGFDPDAPTFPGYTFEDELDRAEELFTVVRAEQAEVYGVDDDELDIVPGGYPRGTVAMANAGPDTNGSQFFIAQGDPTFLPGPMFTVLGTVVEGMGVVDDIVASPTDQLDRPLTEVRVYTIRIEER